MTLLEMIVVMAIIAIAVSATLPRLTVPYQPATPPEVAFIEEQRAIALESGQPVGIYVRKREKDSRTVREMVADPGDRQYALPEKRVLTVSQPRKSDYLDQQLVTMLYPDGTMMRSEFTLGQTDGLSERVLFNVSIDPLHGEIVYAAP